MFTRFKLREVAEDDVGRAVGDNVRPTVENLVTAALQFFTARFHLDENPLRPDQVGVVLALSAALLGDADFASGPGLLHAGMAEGTEKVMQEIGGFALLITGKVLTNVGDKLGERCGRVSHEGMLEDARGSAQAVTAIGAPTRASGQTGF